MFDNVAAQSLHLIEIEVKVSKSDGDGAYQTVMAIVSTSDGAKSSRVVWTGGSK